LLAVELILLVLSAAYAVVAVFLAFLTVCFLVSFHRKFGLIQSIRGFLHDPDRFDHSIIAQIVVGVVSTSALLHLAGMIKIDPENFLLLLTPLIAVPTLLGFRNTSVGTAVGLYGGLVGLVSYAIGRGDGSFYLQHLWLWLPLNVSGYLAGWIAGTIVVGQKKCENIVFALDANVRNAYQVVDDIPQAISSAVVRSYTDLALVEPVFAKSISGAVAMGMGSDSSAGLKLHQILTYASSHRRTIEEILMTLSVRTSYRTPSQVMGAYLNSFASYNTVITLQTTEDINILRIGVAMFHESPSLVWCPALVFYLLEKVHDRILEALRGRGYTIKETIAPSMISFPANIQRSHQYLVDALKEVRPTLSGLLSKEHVCNLKYVEALALEPTRMEKIRESKILRLAVLFLNSILALVYNQVLQAFVLRLGLGTG